MTPAMSMGRIRRYFYGWYHFARAYRMAREKKHGAGKMKFIYAIRMGACARCMVDGQFLRPPRWPRYIRRNPWLHQQNPKSSKP